MMTKSHGNLPTLPSYINNLIRLVSISHISPTSFCVNVCDLWALLILLCLLFFPVWFPRFLTLSRQSESQLAIWGSQEKVSMSVCLCLSAVALWHTSMHHWLTGPSQPPLVPWVPPAARWEGRLWIVFAPGGRSCWAMSGRQNELGGHILLLATLMLLLLLTVCCLCVRSQKACSPLPLLHTVD